MARFVRALAVIAFALSPVWGVPTAHAASIRVPSHAPYWPSFDSSGCNAVTGPFGGVTIACGTGGFVTTQITSAYGGCSQIDIQVNGFGSGPWITSATAPVGGIQNTITINDTGDYFMQLSWVPSTTIGPIQIQMSAPNTGNISIQNITVNPCPIATNTPTANPSSTSTNTPVPSNTPVGSTYTVTPIPTNTPLPSGHNTYTRTTTPTVTPTVANTATPVPPPCPMGWGFYACGFEPSVWTGGWVGGVSPWHTTADTYGGGGQFDWGCYRNVFGSTEPPACKNASVFQLGVLPATGKFCITATNWWDNTGYLGWRDATDTTWISGNTTISPSQTITTCMASDTTGGTTVALYVGSNADSGFSNMVVTFIPAGSTTPVGTYTATATATVTPGSTFTPTITPVPIPGAPETAIPTDTECPGGCAVAKLTQIPGMATVVHVDTSPFDPLKNLSLTRSTCQPFGYVQIPMPVIHGTPALGSTTPLSVTWTTPITGPWDNSIVSGTIVLTNTALQPCAMSEIPTFVWDLTYWLSVLMCAIAWFLWLIGFVGRLSGEETING